jgi:hypothetical protein
MRIMADGRIGSCRDSQKGRMTDGGMNSLTDGEISELCVAVCDDR